MIGNDIDRTSGISDTIAGAGLQGGETATGVQLVQSAASRRIEMKTRRMEKEVVARDARQFVELTQQRVVRNRTVRVPAAPQPGEPDRRWAWFTLGPAELAGEFEIKPVENSMQPENIPQNRADAQMAMTLFAQVPAIDQQKLVEWAIRKMGIENPQNFLAPPNPMIPAGTLNILAARGIPDQVLAEALAQAGGPDLLGGAQPLPGGGSPGGGVGNEAAQAGPGPEPPGEGGPEITQPQLPAPQEPAVSAS
jgi:hypothetical protein